MGAAVDELLATLGERDPFRYPADELHGRQLVAVGELFQERRGQIRVLDRCARASGIDGVKSFEDILPLLLAHSSFKSYPESFIARGNWKGMLHWLATLSSVDVTETNIDGVTDVDEFVDRLHAAGHYVFCSSGTSGKCSFLNQTEADRKRLSRGLCAYWAWPDEPIPPTNERVLFQLSPEAGPARYVENMIGKLPLVRPGGLFNLRGVRFRVSDMMRMGELRRSLASATATPEALADFERDTASQAERTTGALDELTQELIKHRHEPAMIGGTTAQLWAVYESARHSGFEGGDFHPSTTIQYGGGLKNVKAPSDYMKQLRRFYADSRWYLTYGMSEMTVSLPKCEAGNYHRHPWLVMLILDEKGERLLNDEKGRVEGRFAFVDLSVEGRWGGVITGDKVTADFNNTCACGRPGPVIIDPIVRYTGPGEDDKLSCAGTIDGYIRGFIGA